MPSSSPHREEVLELIYGLLAKLEARDKSKRDKAEEELIKTLRSLFQEKVAPIRQQGLQEGLQLGRQEGLRQGIEEENNFSFVYPKGEILEELKTRMMALHIETLERGRICWTLIA